MVDSESLLLCSNFNANVEVAIMHYFFTNCFPHAEPKCSPVRGVPVTPQTPWLADCLAVKRWPSTALVTTVRNIRESGADTPPYSE